MPFLRQCGPSNWSRICRFGLIGNDDVDPRLVLLFTYAVPVVVVVVTGSIAKGHRRRQDGLSIQQIFKAPLL